MWTQLIVWYFLCTIILHSGCVDNQKLDILRIKEGIEKKQDNSKIMSSLALMNKHKSYTVREFFHFMVTWNKHDVDETVCNYTVTAV